MTRKLQTQAPPHSALAAENPEHPPADPAAASRGPGKELQAISERPQAPKGGAPQPGQPAAEAPQQGPSAAETPEHPPADPAADARSSPAAEADQRAPFPHLAQEAFLNILRTADHLDQGLAELLKPFGLTATQYNVLRILRGAGARGLACRQLGARMLTHDPDVTRLLDRLERRGLLARHRQPHDRRVILTGITGEGLRLLEQLDAPVAALHRRQLGHLGADRLSALIALLENARQGQ